MNILYCIFPFLRPIQQQIVIHNPDDNPDNPDNQFDYVEGNDEEPLEVGNDRPNLLLRVSSFFQPQPANSDENIISRVSSLFQPPEKVPVYN